MKNCKLHISLIRKHVGSYDRYIFPINENHWILAVVDLKSNSYMEYDYLKPKRRAVYQEKIPNYLQNLEIHVGSLPKKKKGLVYFIKDPRWIADVV